ncbi:MAG: hypothetical protein Q9214_000451 [Letrouitia sp. 1 TL-2023]
MEEAEIQDQDIKLQRVAPDFISELHRILPSAPYEKQTGQVRTYISEKTANRLAQLIDYFQEWPQLLDPSLADLLSPLVTAFLTYMTVHLDQYHESPPSESGNVLPLPRAICKILYTFCKVRGEKVISRFFNSEPRYLERMAGAFSKWGQNTDTETLSDDSRFGAMAWEEKYIMLLWLSHLMLIPFPLTVMSSEIDAGDMASLPDEMPSNVPRLAQNLISISIFHFYSAGKEQVAATTLLAQLSMRYDMQKTGVFSWLLQWALREIEKCPDVKTPSPIYFQFALLSFLADVTSSAGRDVIAPFIVPIFDCARVIFIEPSPSFVHLSASAIGRKSGIKICRGITLHLLACALPDLDVSQSYRTAAIMEHIIDFLLSSLADNDTPVRLAASKALSMITFKMDTEMAGDVIDAIVGALDEDLVWNQLADKQTPTKMGALDAFSVGFDKNPAVSAIFEKVQNETPTNRSCYHLGSNVRRPDAQKPVFAWVNALRWHGLTLTLAHLVFRHAPPPEKLTVILNRLCLALCFEQRTSVGASLGTNVRDAACFGIWSLARRYKTEELMNIDITKITYNHYYSVTSVLQLIACELVVTASLDPAGNIRRGASAALQELVGRHPDTVTNGISLVQIVDYHAVALRSNAMSTVLISAAMVDKSYWCSLFNGLLTWKAIESHDRRSKTLTCTAIKKLISPGSFMLSDQVAGHLLGLFVSAQCHSKESRYGYLMALAAALEVGWQILKRQDDTALPRNSNFSAAWELVQRQCDTLGQDVVKSSLAAEAACKLLKILAESSTPADSRMHDEGLDPLERSRNEKSYPARRTDSGLSISLNPSRQSEVARSNHVKMFPHPSEKMLETLTMLIGLALSRREEFIIGAAAQAAAHVVFILDHNRQDSLARQWIAEVRRKKSSIIQSGIRLSGIINALGAIYWTCWCARLPVTLEIGSALLNPFLHKDGSDVELKTAAMRSIAESVLNPDNPFVPNYLVIPVVLPLSEMRANICSLDLLKALLAGLSDYTTDHRGDVGSLVRLETLHACSQALRLSFLAGEEEESLHTVFGKIAGLAVEKLDKVRFWACQVLVQNWSLFSNLSKPK